MNFLTLPSASISVLVVAILRDDFALQGFEGGDEDDDVEDIADEPLEDDDDDDDI